MTSELGCDWLFGPEGGRNYGPTPPAKGMFPATEEINGIREAIQNSLDVASGDAPVEVRFTFSKIRSSEFPNLFKVREHIWRSLANWNKTQRAWEIYPHMLTLLSKDTWNGDNLSYLRDRAIEPTDSLGEYVDEIDVLTIGDYNTIGMSYVQGDDASPFNAFLKSSGASVEKPDNAGGSNGFGKETLYSMSGIKTLILSSRTVNGNVVFQGATELATHLNEVGQKVSCVGYYGGTETGEPITEECKIPVRFQRAVPGTDVHLIGVKIPNKDEFKDKLIHATLNHFWLAIHSGKLNVYVEDVEISAATLNHLMYRVFKDKKDGAVNKPENWNPVAYYEAVCSAEQEKRKTAVIKETLDIVGDVILYLNWASDDLPKRVVYMRQPKMVICKKNSSWVSVI